LPAFGVWPMTLPFFFVLENFLVTLPALQWALASFDFALASFRPMTFGTLHLTPLTKPAVTEWFPLIVSVQVPVPEQSPDQPMNLEPAAALAVSVTGVPPLNCAVQVVPQLIPAGELVTVPEPLPDFATVSVGNGTKVAVTVVSEVSATVHVPVPEHPPPDQPAKTEPVSDDAVSVTVVPCAKVNAQMLPQSKPDGLDVIEPEPAPAFAAVSLATAQAGNLKLPMRVRQLNELVVA